ncbi:CLUMA_CG020240, isoform A [Clunio marinus]|uniref:CLUMA_CG020240, isoform A n=1 Tax=Clunio marinus TaxID=568069 RepID=A0A1J1J669_9DIPT|nr:CLUMA_CG020240, isoform A [Clunio marinus]
MLFYEDVAYYRIKVFVKLCSSEVLSRSSHRLLHKTAATFNILMNVSSHELSIKLTENKKDKNHLSLYETTFRHFFSNLLFFGKALMNRCGCKEMKVNCQVNFHQLE